jgi:hypothetical protein
MSKRDEQKTKSNSGTSKSRMKVFVAGFDMEGSDETMAEGFKAIRELSASISRSTILPPTLARKPALSAKSETGVTTVEAEEVEQPVEVVVEDFETDDDTEETSSSNGNGSGQKRSYSFKAPTFLNDLDLNKGTKPLSEFIEAKNPTDAMDKYLVVAFWLQKYMSVEEVTVDHIYTVFDHLGWKAEMPVKPGKPLADLKSKRHVLTREEGATGYKVNFKGEQYIENMGAKK